MCFTRVLSIGNNAGLNKLIMDVKVISLERNCWTVVCDIMVDSQPQPLTCLHPRLPWYGHVEHSSGTVRTQGQGRPKMMREKLKKKDCREWKSLAFHLIYTPCYQGFVTSRNM